MIRGRQANNGMHPIADTLRLKFIQRLGAAGGAGRSAQAVRF
jgi:hypothetical protein